MRWGLIPCWAHGMPLKASTINATVERIESAPSYRDPWSRGQRCIIVMGGFYEPHVNADGSNDPFFVQLNDREVFGVAGLWDRSRRSDGGTSSPARSSRCRRIVCSRRCTTRSNACRQSWQSKLMHRG